MERTTTSPTDCQELARDRTYSDLADVYREEGLAPELDPLRDASLVDAGPHLGEAWFGK